MTVCDLKAPDAPDQAVHATMLSRNAIQTHQSGCGENGKPGILRQGYISDMSIKKKLPFSSRESAKMSELKSESSYFRVRSVPRRPISSIVAKQILYEYDYKCSHCMKTLTPTYELDHRDSLTHPRWSLIPLGKAKSLANDPSNIQPLCRECHGAKTQWETLRDAAARRSLARSRAKKVCSECSQIHSPYFFPACLKASPGSATMRRMGKKMTPPLHPHNIQR